MQSKKFCSRQWKPEKVPNITFFCNKFKNTMKLFLIMDKYSTIVNGLPKESNVECISYFYFYSTTQLQYIVNLSLNFIISFFEMISVSSLRRALLSKTCNSWLTSRRSLALFSIPCCNNFSYALFVGTK
jgi:hypothetical protein